MPNKPEKRFVDLSVDEISLVDFPANEKEYIVMKRHDPQEDGSMKDNQGQDTAATPAEPVEKNNAATDAGAEGTPDTGAEAQTVPVEVEKQGESQDSGESVDDQIARVEKMVQSIAKATGAEEPAEQPAEEPAEKRGEGKKPMKGDMGKKPWMKSLKDAGLTDEQIKAVSSVITEATKKGDQPDEGEGEPAEESTQKADTPAEEPDITSQALDALAMGIQKAKAFTPKRQKALATAITQLSGLLKELEEPTGAAALGMNTGTPTNTLPKDTQFSQGVTVQKSQDPVAAALGEITSVIKGIGDSQKALQERLETIEKARNPQSPAEPEGNATNVQKNASMWSNVL